MTYQSANARIGEDKTQARPKQVVEYGAELQAASGDLERQIASLEERLAPILGHEHPKLAKDATTDEELVPHAGFLRDQARRIRLTTNQIVDLMSRLEI